MLLTASFCSCVPEFNADITINIMHVHALRLLPQFVIDAGLYMTLAV